MPIHCDKSRKILFGDEAKTLLEKPNMFASRVAIYRLSNRSSSLRRNATSISSSPISSLLKSSSSYSVRPFSTILRFDFTHIVELSCPGFNSDPLNGELIDDYRWCCAVWDC
ncbi:hypothetical protein Sjap_010897 [Stephania japonica]|uniref:Uncharacterized protein n=1 Tax=Stephania japonica TaxID=461633 RepID=A0AAP0JC56_9MAGN